MEASVAIQVLPQRVGGNDEVCRIVDEAIAYIQTKFPDAYVGLRDHHSGDYDLCMEVVAGVNRICVEAARPRSPPTSRFSSHPRRRPHHRGEDLQVPRERCVRTRHIEHQGVRGYRRPRWLRITGDTKCGYEQGSCR